MFKSVIVLVLSFKILVVFEQIMGVEFFKSVLRNVSKMHLLLGTVNWLVDWEFEEEVGPVELVNKSQEPVFVGGSN